MSILLNHPDLWRAQFPTPTADTHKYDRGGVVVVGGDNLTGAAILAIRAAMRMGAGVGLIAAHPARADLYRTLAPPHVIIEGVKNPARALNDDRRKAVIIGPGLGQKRGRDVLAVLKTGKSAVVDADALTCFESHPRPLCEALHPSCVLTPHEGEFARLFPSLSGTREERAAQAATQIGACVLLKGAKTVIASPDGRIVINETGSPYLATAGSGDVLSGMIGGLLAQGMPVFDASCACAYLHGLAGGRFGRGLVASDLPDLLPALLQDLLTH